MLLPSLLAIVLASTLVAATGTTGAICSVPAFDWSFNAEGQTPCVVAANLGAVCSSTGDYNIPALQAPVITNLYTPSPVPSPCECSTVVYNLAAACGLCQGGTFTTWFFWKTNCTTVALPRFPGPIPLGTNVPNWAFLDTSASQFNVTLAQRAGDAPESTAILPTSTGISPSQPSSAGSSSVGSSSHKSTNTGAIAGGVVAGILAVGLLGGLLFFYLRRSRNRQHATPMTQHQQPYANGGQAHPGMVATPYQHDSQSQHTSQKPYDPNDPSTFPTSPGAQSMSFSGGSSSQPYQHPQMTPPPPFVSEHSFNMAAHNPNKPGGYSGVAEL